MGRTNCKKICIIGAGPSGMSILHHFHQLQQQGVDIPKLVCYEQQSNWGGLWNYTWRTGTDENGEAVHGSMYHYMWSNGPKEALEYPDYSFEQHFGKAIPSFPPREVLFDYLQSRFTHQTDLKKWITFNHMVKSIRYLEEEDQFTVVVKNTAEDRMMDPELFDMILVASGHFSVPNVPYFTGIENFPGRVMHSHDFRDAKEFSGKRLLCIGSSYSAEDIALQCIKYGAKSVVCSWRSKPMGFKWPDSIWERPLLTEVIEGKTCTFADGSTEEVDAIIMCTGYLHSYKYLEDRLRLKSTNVLYPPNLYNGILWLNGGNNNILYIGVQNQYYTFTMFDVQAKWAAEYVVGHIDIPDKFTMENDWMEWVERNKRCNDCYDEIKFQTDYVLNLSQKSNYRYDLDVSKHFASYEDDKRDDILTYRNKSFTSKVTGTMSPLHHSSFMEAMDDSMAGFC